MPRAINGSEGGGTNSTISSNSLCSQKTNGHDSPLPSSSASSTSSNASTKQPGTPKRNQNNGNTAENNFKNNVNTSSDDLASTDEIKVYKDEGAAEEEQRNSENLNEDKIGLVNETEEEKSSILSHPFSVSNLMLYNGQDHLTSTAAAAAAAAAAQFGLSRNLYHPLYSSPELAHLASWWPAAAGLYNPLSNPHTFPFSSAFSTANYNAQQAAAAAFSRFNPSFFLQPAASSSSSSSGTAGSNISNTIQSDNMGPSNNNNNNNTNTSTLSLHNRLNLSNNSVTTMNGNSQIFPTPNRMSNSDQSNNNPSSHHLNHDNIRNQTNKNTNNPNPTQPNISEIETKSKKPHIKKPLNAFMLFMKEQRSKVVSECTLRESAAINQILGRKWHELDRADQAKYYEMARQERLKHMQLYPGWSARDNYGLKKKRRRKREKIVGENGELPRKCRARYGLHQINLWCKPCRRKKKCIRFTNQDEMTQNNLQMPNMNQGFGNNAQLGYPGMNLNCVANINNGGFSCGSVGEGSSGGVGSGGSLNGGNSEDDYDEYDGLDEDDDDCDEDDENFDDSQDSDTENKNHHLCNNTNTLMHNANNNALNSITTLNRPISLLSNSNNPIIPSLNLNNIHDFGVTNLDQKNELLIKPENL